VALRPKRGPDPEVRALLIFIEDIVDCGRKGCYAAKVREGNLVRYPA